MNILLVYPESPVTFCGFRDALKFISKKSVEPPLGLLTVAAMLPMEWNKKLVDMNVSRLKDDDIIWADYVFLSGMNVQKPSFVKVVKRCNQLGIKVVAGGPMVSLGHEEFPGVDHFILNEAEATLAPFLEDLESGKVPRRVYSTKEYPDISNSPVPLWPLLEMKKYARMSLQFSRGCPFDCEFCSISVLNGSRPRTKTKEQLISEMDSLLDQGWKGSVFIVDDNFIGSRKKIREDILPEMIKWSSERNTPFYFTAEVSIDLAADRELTRMMVDAGFRSVFIGIETPNKESLVECGKFQNKNSDMLTSIRILQQSGLMVSGGFIVGFDHDTPEIFEQQLDFIQKSGIVNAMVGLLNAPPGTRLFDRMRSENRLLESMTGNNVDGSINFIPKMNYQSLVRGYRKLLDDIYSQKKYYLRIKTFLREYRPCSTSSHRLTFNSIKAFIKTVWVLGIIERGRWYFWRLIFLSLLKYPRSFPIALTMAVYGLHFRRIVKNI
jgi:radical SAM superfamily enzyme YgiQ (UPF0313 family)